MTKKVVTNDGKKGGWLVGKRHYDKQGKPLGGIKAVVTDAGDKPVELEGGEVIINREASKKYWKELSRINQSAGNGVPIEPPTDAFDEDPAEDYENGGKIEFNANHIPNKWILNYAIKIKEEHPDVWALGGNIFGNQAFINLKRVAERGHWLDSEEWMYKKWRAFVARHKGDFRIQGVIAMLKWVDKVDKGWQYMKNLIEEEIKKREARKSKKMNDGGNLSKTPAPAAERIKGSKFNAPGTAKDSKSGDGIKFDENTLASIKSLIDAHNEKYPSKKITLGVAKAVVRRGMGAYSGTHRPTITGGKPNSRTAWGLARLKAFIYKAEKGNSKSGKYSQDNDLFDDLGIKVSKFDKGGEIDKIKTSKDENGNWKGKYLDYKFTLYHLPEGWSFTLYYYSQLMLSNDMYFSDQDFPPFITKKAAIQSLIEVANDLKNKYKHGGLIELEKGIKAEYEHAKTIAKFKREGVSVRDVARSIAEDHLKEDPHYYSKLAKMEGKKFATGGLVTDIGGTANVGDKGTLETRNGRIDILITGITDKKVRFKIVSDNNRPDSNPVERFVRNYRGASTSSSTPTPTITPTPTKATQQTSGEWRTKTEAELISDGTLDTKGNYLGIGIDMLRPLLGKTLTELEASPIIEDELDRGVRNLTPSLKGWAVNAELFTNKPLPSTQSTVVHELENYRIRTEQEFINEYGKNWQKQVGWLSGSNNMDWLFGEKITDIVTSDRYDTILKLVKNGSRFESDFSTKNIIDVYWTITPYMYMFDPVLYSQNAITNLGQTKQKDTTSSRDETAVDAKFEIGDTVYIRKDIADYLDVDFDSNDNVFRIVSKEIIDSDKNYYNPSGAIYKIEQIKNIANKRIFKLPGNSLVLVDSGQSKPVLSEESLQELFKDVTAIDKEREQLEATPQKNETQINDELKALDDEYNDLLFLIDITPSTDVDNMLSLKLQAKQLKDKIDLLHLDLKKKVDGELQLLDNLFNASAVQPQERYKFNPYNDGFAPDGQPTSLPKNLYDWTMTQEFQNWFGNFTNAYNYRNSSYENVPCSVVVNKHYEPLVVYHGTGVEFSFFKFDKFPAMYFAENEAYSNWFAEMKGQQSGTNGYVYPFFLNIRTPLDLTIYGIEPVAPDDFIDWMFLQTGLDAEELKISKALLDPSQKFQAWMYLRNSPEMLNVLRDKAICDGIIYYEDNPSVDKSSDAYQTKAYIVFNSNSAKIADPNREMMTIPAMRSFYLKRGGKL